VAPKVRIKVQTAHVRRGGSGIFNVDLVEPRRRGANVPHVPAGIQNDIWFDYNTPIAARDNGKPDCIVKPQLAKGGFFSFQPPGCNYRGTDR